MEIQMQRNLNINDVPFLDLSRKINAYKPEIDEAIQEVLHSGTLVMGTQVQNFEKEFAKYLGVKYCIGTANGTESIEIALRTLSADNQTIVATCANAGGYSSAAIKSVGSKALYMDVDLITRNISCESVEKAIDMGATIIIATHLYGSAIRDIELISDMCADRAIPLIEDCAQAHGAMINGKKTGSFGDLAAFSFYPTKNLGALGDGGAIVTNHDEHYSKAKKLHQYGWAEKYKVAILGGRNSRLDEIQASILRVFLRNLDKDNAKRLQIADYYNCNIQSENIQKPIWAENDFVAHLYVISSKSRSSYLEKLKINGIGSVIHYPIPDHLQKNASGTYANLPNTEALSNTVFSLPCYPELSENELSKVAEIVSER